MSAVNSILQNEKSKTKPKSLGKFKKWKKRKLLKVNTTSNSLWDRFRKNRRKALPFVIGIVAILIPVTYFGLKNAQKVEATAYPLVLSTAANTIQVDVQNRYRAVMTTNDTEEYIEIYDRGESDTSPDATHEIKGPCIENYCLRDDDSRITTIVEVTPVRIRVKVSGRLNRETATNYRNDNSGNDITVTEYYTFTQRGVFVENNVNFPAGLTLAADSGLNGYNWLGVFADQTDAAFDDGSVIYYGDGNTENTTSTDNDEWSKTNRYVVLPGTGSDTYQDAYVGIANSGWYDDNPGAGAAEWRWEEQNTSTEDLLVAQEQNYLTSGQHAAAWYLLLFDEDEIDTEVEREGIYNDYNGYDDLTFYDTGSAGIDGSGNSFNTGENAYVIEMAEDKARWSISAGSQVSTAVGAGATSITEIELSDSGHYFVHYNLFTELGSGGTTGQRRATWGNITIDGTPSEYGWSTGYLRDSSTADDGYQSGAAIINAPSGGEKLKIGIQRYDDNSTDTLRVRGGNSGVGVLKLDESWDYLMLGLDSDSSDIQTNTTFTAIDFDRNDEVDTGSFGHSESTNPEDITLVGASGDKYLVNATVTLDTTETGTRQNYEMRLSLNGAAINGTTVTGYLRGSDTIMQTTLVYTGIIAKTSASDQTLNVEVRRESETNVSTDTTVVSAGKTTLSAVQIPSSGVDYFRVTETATTQNMSTTRTAITFNSTTEEDTGTFDHDSAVNLSRINMQQDANILVFGHLFSNRSNTSGTREELRADFQADGTTLWGYGGFGSYNRGSGGSDGAQSSGAAGAAILHGVTNGSYLELTQINEATDQASVYNTNQMNFQGVNLDDLLTTPAYEIYSLASPTSDITTSQTFITWDTNELSSGGGGVSAGDTTMEVSSTSGFPNAGVAYIGSDKFSYTNTTATTFTGIPSSGDLALLAHSDGEVVSLTNRHDPTFKFQNYRSFAEPENISVNGQLIPRSEYTMGVKPFSNAYFADDLVYYSTMQNSGALTSPDIGDGTGASVAASFTSAKYGSGIQVDDNADDTYIPMNGNIPTQTGTIEFWYRETSGVDALGNFFSSDEGANEFELRRNSSNTSVAFALNTTTITWTTKNIYDNEWHHIRFTYDTVGDVYELFVDGESQGQDTTALTDVNVTGYNLYIGMDQDGAGDRVDGIIDEFRIYNSTSVQSVSAGGDTGNADEYLNDETNDYTLGFNALSTDNEGEYLFMGADDPFFGVNIDLNTEGKATSGTNLSLQWQYWNGSAWANLTTYDQEPGAKNLTKSGAFYFSDPGDWEPISVYDPNALYYVRAYLNSGTYDVDPIENLMKTDILLFQHITNLSLPDMVYAIPGGFSSSQNNKGTEPVAHWLMDDAYGSITRDRTSYANELTISGATWQTESGNRESYRARFLRFDGSNDRLTRANDGDFNFGAGGFTITGWFRHDNTISGTDMLLAHFSSAGYKIYMNSSGYLCFGIDDDSSWSPDDTACTSSSVGSLADNKWHHFGAVKESNTAIRLYIDGKEMGKDTTLSASQTLNTSSTLYIGIDTDASSNPWDGDLDNIFIYPYARSSTQIKADMTTPQTTAAFGNSVSDPLQNGLMVYWPFDESAENTCTGGSNDACDQSGNNRDGAWTGSTAMSGAGKFSKGIVPTTSAYVNVPDNNALDITGSITLATWVNRDNINNSDTIIYKGGSATELNYGLSLNTSVFQATPEFTFYNGTTITHTANSIIPNTEWVHLTTTYDGQKVKIYINGVLDYEAAETTPLVANNSSLRIGTNSSGAADFQGTLDDMRIYNRALSPAEVSNLYNWTPQPQGYWDLDENSGTTTVYDKSDNDKDGTLNGTMTESDWVPGKLGSALDLDGSDDYIQISSPTLPTNDFTYMAWVNLDDTSDESILMATDGAGNDELAMQVNTNNFDVVVDGTTISGTATLNVEEWNHLAIVRKGSAITTYINGIEDATGTDGDALNFGLCQLLIGTDSDSICNGSLGNYMNGVIDDIKVYNYALTPKDLSQIIGGGSQAKAGEPLVYLKFDENYGDTANDASIYNNNGNIGAASTCPGAAACPTWTANGKYDNALDYDGSDDVVRLGSVPSNLSTSGDSIGSISMWVQPDWASTTTTTTRAFFSVDDGVSDGISLAFCGNDVSCASSSIGTAGDLILVALDGGSVQSKVTVSNSNYSWSVDEWVHLTVVWDDSSNEDNNMEIYINGNKPSQSRTSASSFDVSALTRTYATVGNGSAGTTSVDGVIDEFKLYNGILTQDEINVEYNAGAQANFGRGYDETDAILGGGGNDPVGYWDFNENTGTSTVYDKSGNENNLTMNGSMTESDWVPGKFGSALDFDGTDDNIENTNVGSELVLTGDLTLSAWVFRNTTTTDDGIVEVDGDGSGEAGNRLYGFYINDNDNVLRLQWEYSASQTTEQISSTVGLTNASGVWTHLLVTRDVSTNEVEFFENGVKLGNTVTYTNDPTGGTSSPDLEIGKGLTGDEFDGKLDEIKVYDYEMNPAQIAYEYNRGKPVGWWALDDCSGTNIDDRGPHSNNGSITIGSSGSNTSVGTCASGSTTEAWNNGTVGKYEASLSLDGTDDFVGLSNPAELQNFPEISLMAWIKGDALPAAAQDTIINKDTSGYQLGINNQNIRFRSDDLTSASTDGNTVLSDGTWYHVAATFDGSNVRIYLNGVQDGIEASAGSISNTSATLYLGVNGAEYFDGQLDDVRIYNYALSQDQIQSVYNFSSVQFGYD